MKSLLLTCFLVIVVLVNQSIENPVKAEELRASTEAVTITTR